MRRCRVFFDRRIRSRSDQEAREDPARQGRRSHPAHAGDRRADRTGVPDLSRIDGRWTRSFGASSTHHAAVRLHRARWRASRDVAGPANENQAIVDAFARIDALYIADGHHRAASAAGAARRKSLRLGGPGSEADRVLAVAFPDNQVQVLPYNRVVKDLNGMTTESFWRRSKRPRRRARASRRCRCKRARSRCT